MIGRDLTSMKKIPSSHRPYDLRMFRFMIIFMACIIIGESYMVGGYSQNVGLGLKLSPHPMPPFLECPPPWGFMHYM
jgi:hypothetical protein